MHNDNDHVCCVERDVVNMAIDMMSEQVHSVLSNISTASNSVNDDQAVTDDDHI